MHKNRQIKWVLGILVMIMIILCFKFIMVKNKFVIYKNNKVTSSVIVNQKKSVEKFGYSNILECLGKNKNFKVETFNMIENGKCSVEVNYKGDLNLLYSSLVKLNKSRNLLNIRKIIIHKDTKIANMSIDFKKTK